MGGRKLTIQSCTFKGNKSRFAGAVRINDIGSARIEDSLFIGNVGTGRGGAICTQIEKPDEQKVLVKNTLFCFNESPMSPHIYNYRTATHTCSKCSFNTKQCCSNHGRVVKAADATNQSFVSIDGKDRTRVCQCEQG